MSNVRYGGAWRVRLRRRRHELDEHINYAMPVTTRRAVHTTHGVGPDAGWLDAHELDEAGPVKGAHGVDDGVEWDVQAVGQLRRTEVLIGQRYEDGQPDGMTNLRQQRP
jgi:hypothetical protein